MYKLLRSFLFRFGPEKVHSFSMKALQIACRSGVGEKLLAAAFRPKVEPVKFFGLSFPNRVGLAAGFDKDAAYLRELQALGFGFVEIGTVTPRAQAGNDQPRLIRLPRDKALINRMGFNNHGVQAAAEKLKAWQKSKHNNRGMIIGGNIGKNKITPNDDAWQDYVICFEALHPFVNYFVVNVSSPNTPGLRELQEKDSLRKIFTALQQHHLQQQNPKPILLKIAPDLSTAQVDDVISLALEINLDGLVVSNTTLSREKLSAPSARIAERFGAGGLSGLPVKEKNTMLVNYISKQTNGKIPIMASGGIFTAEDAAEKLAAGAALLQVYTGFIYEGPALVKKLVQHLEVQFPVLK